jgi:hypothetical protein
VMAATIGLDYDLNPKKKRGPRGKARVVTT